MPLLPRLEDHLLYPFSIVGFDLRFGRRGTSASAYVLFSMFDLEKAYISLDLTIDDYITLRG